MTTRRGRSLYTGIFIMPFQQLTRGYISSTCGSEATHSVSGIFCDVMKSDKERLQNLGMIWQPIPLDSLDDALAPAIPALRTCEPKKVPLREPPTGSFSNQSCILRHKHVACSKTPASMRWHFGRDARWLQNDLGQ